MNKAWVLEAHQVLHQGLGKASSEQHILRHHKRRALVWGKYHCIMIGVFERSCMDGLNPPCDDKKNPSFSLAEMSMQL